MTEFIHNSRLSNPEREVENTNMQFTEQLMISYVDQYRKNTDELCIFLGKHADFKGSCVVTWSTSGERTAGEIKEMIPRHFPEAQDCDPKFKGGNGVQLPSAMEAAVLYKSLDRLLEAMGVPGDRFKVQVHKNDGTQIIAPKIE